MYVGYFRKNLFHNIGYLVSYLTRHKNLLHLVCLNILRIGYPTNTLNWGGLYRFLTLDFCQVNLGSFIIRYFIKFVTTSSLCNYMQL
jgi:hypothetical protein